MQDQKHSGENSRQQGNEKKAPSKNSWKSNIFTRNAWKWGNWRN